MESSFRSIAAAAVLAAGLAACTRPTPVQVLDAEMAKVRDYVPAHAVMAHRGSTYWAPEETESAWRWARETGADYLESDLQCTRDGIILANHDENLTRTTNIAEVFGEGIPACRKAFYLALGFSRKDAEAQLERDKATFKPYYAASYYYAELLTLDAGGWFNEANPERARPAFKADYDGSRDPGALAYSTGQYVSALQDQIAYAEGKCLLRGKDGRRILPYRRKAACAGMSLEAISTAAKQDGKYMEFVDYDFSGAYATDPADTGNRPGIYIEFKEPEVNPEDMEQRVYDILDAAGWNILTQPAEETAFYRDGKVNVGNTNGKVILQTFSPASLQRAHALFQGKVPMCFLLWPPCPAEIEGGDLDTPEGFATILKWAQDNGAHISGPSIAGAPNNYEELNEAWQADLVRRSGMLNHPYSFDSLEQMETQADRTDGFFTNRSEMTLRFLLDHGLRDKAAPQEVPDAEATLDRLGY